MSEGYCTVDDVRRVLQEVEFTGALDEDSEQAVVDAIVSQTEWLQETTNRHWYESGGISEDTHGLVPSSTRTHTEDEQDIPTKAFLTTERRVRPRGLTFRLEDPDDPAEHGGLAPRTFRGPFTRVTLHRRDVQTISELLVLHSENGYEDWVAGTETEGRSGAYYTQVDDSTGLSRLYLDTNSIDDELENYSSAVVVTYDYGIDGLTGTVRRAIALRSAAQLVRDDELTVSVPDQGQLVNVDTKAQAWKNEADELLEIHL